MPGHIYVKNVNDMPRESRYSGAYQRTGVIMDQALLSFLWIEPEAADLPVGEVRSVHIHPEDQLMYIISGYRTYLIGGDEYRAGPGDVVYIPAGVEHGGRSEPGDGPVHLIEMFAPIRTDYLYICEHQTALVAPERNADGSRAETRPLAERIKTKGKGVIHKEIYNASKLEDGPA